MMRVKRWESKTLRLTFRPSMKAGEDDDETTRVRLAPRRSVPQHGTIRQNTHYRNKKLTTTFSTLSKFTWRQEKNGVEYRKRTLREKRAQWRRVDYRQWPSRMLSIYGRHWTGQVATATFLIKGLRSFFFFFDDAWYGCSR